MDDELADAGEIFEAFGRPYISPSDKSLLHYRMTRRHTDSLSTLSSSPGSRYHSDHNPDPSTPPLLSSPSAASLSSHGALSAALSPVSRRELNLSQSTLHHEEDGFPASHGRVALAHRLSQLAQQLTENVDIDETALTRQLDQLEKTVSRSPSRTSQAIQPRPGNVGVRSQSDMGGTILNQSPAPLLTRSRYSDLAASVLNRMSEPAEADETAHEDAKKGMTARQADKVIVEAAKLNKELSVVVDNLKARLEESDHIHSLLIERAERAAQRIIFLQNRISYLEEELQENDDELQHLRICLKAVEIQLPPHPDHEIQRCISTFKADYKALKQKRVSRSSITSFSSLDNSQA